LATVSPRPLTRPPTPVSRPPGRPVPDTVPPSLLTPPPTRVRPPSTGAPKPVAAPTCWVRPVTVSTTGARVGSSDLPTPPSASPSCSGRALSTASPVLPSVVSSKPAGRPAGGLPPPPPPPPPGSP